MAKGIKCGVKFGKFKWSRGGYAEVMDGGGVQSLLRKRANAIESACNSSYEPGDGYVAHPFQGSLAKGYAIGTTDQHAANSEHLHNRLKKNLRAGGE